MRLIETGARENLHPDTIASLASALGVTTDWLILGTGPEPTVEQVRAAVAAARERLAAAPKVTGTEG